MNAPFYALGAVLLALLASSPALAGTANTGATALDMAQSASHNPGSVVTATWLLTNPGSHAVDDDVVTPAGFPTHGADYAILTSGRGNNVDCGCAQSAQTDGSYGTTHTDHADPDAEDTSILKITYSVPSSHNHIQATIQFLSEEYPDFSGTQFNDGAYMEWKTHSWNYNGGPFAPSAPDNFAKDPAGALLTINSASMTAADAAGSIYDGATCRLTVYQEIEPGLGDLYISVTDVSDTIYDTALFVDGIKTLYKATTPDATCNPQPPPLEIEAENLNICLDTIFTVVSPQMMGPTVYKWNFGDSSFGSTSSPSITHNYAAPGTYTVTVEVLDGSDFYEGSIDVEIADCGLVADATYQLSYTEYYGYVKTQVPIFGGATGNFGEVTCIWTGPTSFDNAGSCNTTLMHDEIADFVIELTATDQMTGKQASDKAWVHILPLPPSLSLDEQVVPALPEDRIDSPTALKDSDGDGKADRSDLCPDVADIGGRDLDSDGLGDACDLDDDNDGVLDLDDNCRVRENRGLMDTDADGLGDACDPDDDNDGVQDWKANDAFSAVPLDNCRLHGNADQANLDGDAVGDACDADRDGDQVADLEDAQPENPQVWSDANRDGIEDSMQDLDTSPQLQGAKSGSPVGVQDGRASPPWMLVLAGLGAAVVMVAVAAFMVGRKE